MSKKQQTLFQSWNTVKSSSTVNPQNVATNLFNDEDDDLLRSALEETSDSYAVTCTANEEAIPGFDTVAGSTWIYPTNKPIRKYQRDIVETCLFHNTLVTLPTGLGKTFIAAVVMYNFFRWYPKGKIVFMAPTKPLVAQQIQACYEIMGIPFEITCEMTGAMNPQERKKLWNEKRVFYLTPQVLTNDISRGACPASGIKCLVLDEAHKALGNYAYVQVVQELIKYGAVFRVLALSATPGSDMKAIQQVISNLLIARIELRSEESPDILPYTHNRLIDKIVVPLGSDINQIRESFLEILGIYARRLMSMNILFAKDIGSLTKYSIFQSRERFRRNPPENCPRNRFGVAEGDFAMCLTLTHALELLTQHGIRAFYHFLFDKTDWEGESTASHNRTRTELLKQPGFIRLMDQLKLKYGDNISRLNVSHPKLTKLEEIVVEHFKRCQSENIPTRVMIFSQYRDSVHEIVAILMEHAPLIKAMSFVGHGPSGTGGKGKGFTQADQIRVIKEFTEGNYNTLVSTCVGEEGLDIGDVDMIICYDMHKSPVRLVQRCGRTGRKRDGRVVMLMTEGREEHTFNQSVLQKKNLHKSITSNQKLQSFLSKDLAPMIPRHLSPRCHEMPMQVAAPQAAQISRPARTGNGEAGARKVKTSKCYFLNDAETSYFDEKFRTESLASDFNRKLTHLRLELNRWLPWQLSLQASHQVGHSTLSQNLVKLLQIIQENQDDFVNSPALTREESGFRVENHMDIMPQNNSKATSEAFFELSWDDFDDKSFRTDSPEPQIKIKLESDAVFELSWNDFEDASEDWQNNMNIKLSTASNCHLYDRMYLDIFPPSSCFYSPVNIPSPPSLGSRIIEGGFSLRHSPEENSYLTRVPTLFDKFLSKRNPYLQSALKKISPFCNWHDIPPSFSPSQDLCEVHFPNNDVDLPYLHKCIHEVEKKTTVDKPVLKAYETSPVISQRCAPLSSKRKLSLEFRFSDVNKTKRIKRDIVSNLEEDECKDKSVKYRCAQNYASLLSNADVTNEELESATNRRDSLLKQEKSLLSVTEIIEQIEFSLESNPLECHTSTNDIPDFDLQCDFLDSEPIIETRPTAHIASTKTVKVEQKLSNANEDARAQTPSLDFFDDHDDPSVLVKSPGQVKPMFPAMARRLLRNKESCEDSFGNLTREEINCQFRQPEQSVDYKALWDEAFKVDWKLKYCLETLKDEAILSGRKEEPRARLSCKLVSSDIKREVEEIFGPEESSVSPDEELSIQQERTRISVNERSLQMLAAADSDLESPIRFKRLGRNRCNLFVSQSTPVLKESSRRLFKDSEQSKHFNPSRDKPKARQFFEEEAELSLVDGSCSDDEDESKDIDGYEGSFIDDDGNTPAVNDTMHAVYLKSVKSPVNRGEFVFRPPAAPMNRSDIFSQAVVEDSDYVFDSFCVESDESDEHDRSHESEITALSESVGRKPRLARLKALNIKNHQARIAGARSRKRILYDVSSEDESENSSSLKSLKTLKDEAVSSHDSTTKGDLTEIENDSGSVEIISDGTRIAKDHDEVLSSFPLGSTAEKNNVFTSLSPDTCVAKTSSTSMFSISSSFSGSGLKLFVSSRQVPIVGHIISSLRTKSKISVEICSFDCADFVLSTRLGVLRKSHADFVNGSNRSRLQEQIRSLTSCYDKPYLIVEADRTEAGDSFSRRNSSSCDVSCSIFKPNSPYFLQTVLALAKGDITVLHSDSQECTAQLLSDLSRQEALKGFNLPGGIKNTEQEMTLKFLECIPEINPSVALVMVASYKNLREILCSSRDVLAQRCMISHTKAQKVFQALRVIRE